MKMGYKTMLRLRVKRAKYLWLCTPNCDTLGQGHSQKFAKGGQNMHTVQSRPLPFLSPLLPSLPLPPFPLPSLPFLPLPFPSPSLRSRLHIVARGLWERLSSPSGPGQSPAAKRFLVNFKLKIAHLVAMVLRSFSGNATT